MEATYGGGATGHDANPPAYKAVNAGFMGVCLDPCRIDTIGPAGHIGKKGGIARQTLNPRQNLPCKRDEKNFSAECFLKTCNSPCNH
jgi:hypothetical protein